MSNFDGLRRGTGGAGDGRPWATALGVEIVSRDAATSLVTIATPNRAAGAVSARDSYSDKCRGLGQFHHIAPIHMN
jgi:hypothetical protein